MCTGEENRAGELLLVQARRAEMLEAVAREVRGVPRGDRWREKNAVGEEGEGERVVVGREKFDALLLVQARRAEAVAREARGVPG